jgi:hypothetical protein
MRASRTVKLYPPWPLLIEQPARIAALAAGILRLRCEAEGDHLQMDE